MNLSALNTGLAQAPTNPLTEAQTSANALSRLPSGTLSGEDFAAFLRNQIEALKHTKRQDLAASKAVNLPPGKLASPTNQVQQEAVPRSQEPNDHLTLDHHASTADAIDQSASQATTREAAPNDRADAAADAQAVDNQTNTMREEAANPAAPEKQAIDAQPSKQPMRATELTTIPLSPNFHIITTTQSLTDDESVADFALAMGLAPDQVKALFGPNAVAVNPVATAVSTQQILGFNSLANVSAPALLPEPVAPMAYNPIEAMVSDIAVSSADFQGLDTQTVNDEAGLKTPLNTLEILNFQAATAASAPGNAATPVSTLAVLSMLSTELRAEDIEALKNEFDGLKTLDSTSKSEPGLSLRMANANPTPLAASKTAASLAAQPNMAETFDKLSQKLVTELAGRMQDQLNAGEWKMKFALKPASLGLVDVQLEMRDGQMTAQFNADKGLTQELIQSGSQRLKDALNQLGMNNASVLVGQGQNQHQGFKSPQQHSAEPSDNRVKLSDTTTDEAAVSARPRHSNSSQFDHYA